MSRCCIITQQQKQNQYNNHDGSSTIMYLYMRVRRRLLFLHRSSRIVIMMIIIMMSSFLFTNHNIMIPQQKQYNLFFFQPVVVAAFSSTDTTTLYYQPTTTTIKNSCIRKNQKEEILYTKNSLQPTQQQQQQLNNLFSTKKSISSSSSSTTVLYFTTSRTSTSESTRKDPVVQHYSTEQRIKQQQSTTTNIYTLGRNDKGKQFFLGNTKRFMMLQQHQFTSISSPISSTSTIRTRMNHHDNKNKRSGTKTFPILTSSSSLALASASAAVVVSPATFGISTVCTAIVNYFQQVLHVDPMYCLCFIMLISTMGIQCEQRTTIGKALSAPLVTMGLGLLAANMGTLLLPFTSPVYMIINTYLVALAVPMLLYDSNLRRVRKDTGTLLIAFLIGAFATVIGTLVAFPFVPMKNLVAPIMSTTGITTYVPVGWKVACALTARHIGGAINFVAVAETLAIPGTIISAAIAADNVVVALYFTFLFAIAKPNPIITKTTSTTATISSPTVETKDETGLDDYMLIPISSDESSNSPTTTTTTTTNGGGGSSGSSSNTNDVITLTKLAMSLSISALFVTIGTILTNFFLPLGTSSLPLTSFVTVTAATLYPTFFRNLRAAGTAVGIFFIQMFFAVSGASGSIALVLQQAPTLFVFSILQITIHFIVLITIGRYCFGGLRNNGTNAAALPYNELYLASNANIGGPTTAAAMATAKNWQTYIVPALLIGILGYATATGIALALGPILRKMTETNFTYLSQGSLSSIRFFLFRR